MTRRTRRDDNGPRRGTAFGVAFLFLIIGNGPVLLLVAYFLRHLTMTASSWRTVVISSLVVGGALPLAIVAAWASRPSWRACRTAAPA